MEFGINKEGYFFYVKKRPRELALVQNRSKSVLRKLVRGIFHFVFVHRVVQIVSPDHPVKFQHEFDVRHKYQSFPQI
ncbi:MAG: hypothetical protein KDD50_03615 [Bdellovibrionales bacterium]|nr:hypothetical protein [Bdellovibrionales bacterium]